MLGRTHFVLGMASALVITRPQSVSGVITAMTAGAIGGWIVDIDIKSSDIEWSDDADRESVYDILIDGLIFLAFIALDFLIGKGMCQYVINNWGVIVWGSLFGIIILLIIGFNTKHRTFTHSFLALALFFCLMYLFCRPAAIPFVIGYASHLVADFFNKLGLQLFFPLKWRPCLKLCRSDKKVNRILFWISLAIDIVLGAYLFAEGMNNVAPDSKFILFVTDNKLFGFNALQLYLLFINLVTFFGFQRDHRQFMNNVFDAYTKGKLYNDVDYETPESRFHTWLLDIFVFLGGGVGMILSLVINFEIPKAYNGNWWAFCVTSILFWFTVYCYLCNPFGFEMHKIQWFSIRHIPLLLYLIGINVVSAKYLYSLRKKKFSEEDGRHTIIFLLGVFGGTFSEIPMVFFINRQGKYFYVKTGFFMMLMSQIVFIMYMMSAGVL